MSSVGYESMRFCGCTLSHLVSCSPESTLDFPSAPYFIHGYAAAEQHFEQKFMGAFRLYLLVWCFSFLLFIDFYERAEAHRIISPTPQCGIASTKINITKDFLQNTLLHH